MEKLGDLDEVTKNPQGVEAATLAARAYFILHRGTIL